MKLSTDPDITGNIYSLLYELGLTANSISFFHTAYAVHLALEQPQKLLLVTKWLYPEVAKHYHSNWRAVERNIRRLIQTVWTQHREQLDFLAGQNLQAKPTPAQFLSLLVYCLQTELTA